MITLPINPAVVPSSVPQLDFAAAPTSRPAKMISAVKRPDHRPEEDAEREKRKSSR